MIKRAWVQRQKYVLCACGLIFVISLISQLLCGISEFTYGDSWDYWERGESLWKDNTFSLLNQRDGFRGYVFPLFLGVCNYVGGMLGYRFVNSIIFSVTFAILLPELLEIKINNIVRCISVVIYYVLFILFFGGLQNYALSDFFAIFLMLICCLTSKKIIYSSIKKSFFLSVLLGMGLYFTYNVRTIYMFAGLYLMGYVLYKLFRETDIKKIMFNACGCIIGMGFAGIPQLYMNLNYIQEKTIRVPTNGLMLKQLEWGLRYQRYDTYIGIQQEIPQMYFVDVMGENILKKEGLFEIGLQGWGDYFRLLIQYPIEMVGIYTRHFLNMLLPVWPNQYVLDLDNNKIFILITAFSIFYIFIVACTLDCMNKKGYFDWLPLLIPMMLITPGAVETRFYTPLYLMVLGMILFRLDWISLRSKIVLHKWKIIISYIACFCIMVSIWGTLLASESAYYIFW